MKKLPLWVYFSLAVIALWFGGAFFPSIRLAPFAPFLVICFYRTPFRKCLTLAFASGLLIDLLSTQFRFGLFGVIHLLTAALLYGQKKHFFEDKPLPFCLYSALTSAFLSGLSLLAAKFSSMEMAISFPVLLSDLIFMPLIDGLYAFLWFICPVALYSLVKKQKGA